MAKNKDQASLYKSAIDKIKNAEKEQMEKAGYVPDASGSGWYKPKKDDTEKNEAEIADMVDKAEYEKNKSGKPMSDMSYTKKAWDEEFKKRGVTYDQALQIKKKRDAAAESRLMEKSKKTILEAGE